MLCYGKLIPNRGAWLEFETSNKDVISVKVDRKRKIPVTTLLRAIGFCDRRRDRSALFAEADNMPDHPYILRTIDKEPPEIRTRHHCRRTEGRAHRVLPPPAPGRSADAKTTPTSSWRTCSSAPAAMIWAWSAATSSTSA